MVALKAKKVLLLDDNRHSPTRGAFLNSFEYKFLLDEGFDVYSISFPSSVPEHASNNDFFFEMPKSRLRKKLIKFLSDTEIESFVKEVIEDVQPDLIHCHLLSLCPAAVYKAIDSSIPVIQTLHGPSFFCATSWGCYQNSRPCELGIGLKCYIRGCVPAANALLYTNLKRRYWKNISDKVDVFHCPSRQIMNSALGLGLDKVINITLCINQVFMNVEREPPMGDPTAIFVGSLEQCKGVDVLIDAMQIVQSTVPEAKLIIAGKGSIQWQLEKKAKKLGLHNNVTFIGHVTQETLLGYYKNSSVFVMPSLWQEQFGLVGPEAMACGLPCIGSDIGGIPEWLRHGEWGALVPPGNVEQLARSIVFYLTHPEISHTQGLTGQVYARKAFRQSRYRKDIVELITKLIDEKK